MVESPSVPLMGRKRPSCFIKSPAFPSLGYKTHGEESSFSAVFIDSSSSFQLGADDDYLCGFTSVLKFFLWNLRERGIEGVGEIHRSLEYKVGGTHQEDPVLDPQLKHELFRFPSYHLLIQPLLDYLREVLCILA